MKQIISIILQFVLLLFLFNYSTIEKRDTLTYYNNKPIIINNWLQLYSCNGSTYISEYLRSDGYGNIYNQDYYTIKTNFANFVNGENVVSCILEYYCKINNSWLIITLYDEIETIIFYDPTASEFEQFEILQINYHIDIVKIIDNYSNYLKSYDNQSQYIKNTSYDEIESTGIEYIVDLIKTTFNYGRSTVRHIKILFNYLLCTFGG